MLGSWLIYLVPGLVGTGLLSLVATKKGRQWLRKRRGRMRRRAVKDSKQAWKTHQAARAATPRGQLRARRRAEPKRLTFGHRRRPDDPVAARVWIRKAHERARVARANRRATRPPRPRPLLQLATERASAPPSFSRQCGSTATVDGAPCRNRCLAGRDACHLHTRRAA